LLGKKHPEAKAVSVGAELCVELPRELLEKDNSMSDIQRRDFV
jgi:hypothetical protein